VAEIDLYARILALADVYDAMHRINDATGGQALSGEEIRRRMLDSNPDQRHLVGELYAADILTTRIYQPEVGDTEPITAV
jgi:streptomycin 6-kinase